MLNVKLTVFCLTDLDISSSFVGIVMSGAGPGIQLVFLRKHFYGLLDSRLNVSMFSFGQVTIRKL